MKLVVVESPAKAKTINKYLGKDFNVIASFGHIRDLPSQVGSVLPDEDFAMKYEISSKSASHVKAICEAAKKSDHIYLATDPDREGESISWHVVEALKLKNALKKDVSVKRIVFNEITKKAVTSAIENPRDIDVNLVNAQQARRALDYLVGFTLSPLLWKKLPGSRSAGRVQSVALRIICDRELEIEKFITQEYWSISSNLSSPKGDKFFANLTHADGEKLDKFSITNAERANELSHEAMIRKYLVSSVDKKQQKRHPAAPFITSSLQQEAARKLGFTAKKTMQVAQKLYEGLEIEGENVGLITYMRTDGVSLSDESVNSIRKWIDQVFGDKYVPSKPRIYKSKAKNAQEAHEAIRPTDVLRTPDSLKGKIENDQLKLYDLIWKRTVACQMESVLFDIVTADIASEDKKYSFRAVGSVIAFDGFYKIYHEGKDDEEDEEYKLLPVLNVGEEIKIIDILPKQHFTEPPPRYTEASLVKKLEELGIGRPSTYATIISVLQDRNYVKLEKKRFFPEERGLLVTAFLSNFCTKYVEYDFTADLENELDEVAEGRVEWKDLMRKFWVNFKANVDDASQYKISDVIVKLESLLESHYFGTRNGEVSRKCPSCDNGTLGLKLGKYGAFIACNNYPECKFTKQISQGDSDESGEEVKLDENSRLLGQSASGEEIYVKKGPYGFYVQVGQGGAKKGEKPKRASIPSSISAQDIELSKAIKLLEMPYSLGIHPETSIEMLVGSGKFGPYVKYDGKFYSIPKHDDFLEMTQGRAMETIASKTKK